MGALGHDVIPGYVGIGLVLILIGVIVWMTRGPISRGPRWERWGQPSGPPSDSEIRSLRFRASAIALGMVIAGLIVLSSGIGLLPPFGDPPT